MNLATACVRRAAVFLALTCMPWYSSQLGAQTQYGVAQSRGDGYVFEGQNGWPVGQGYRPVRVLLRSGKVTGNDRQFTIEIENQDYNSRKFTTTSERLTIPAGARSGEVVITVPQTELWVNQQFKVYEGGRHLDKLDNYASTGNLYAYGSGLSLPSFLCISDQTVDTSLLTEAMDLARANQQGAFAYGNLSTSTINGRAQYPSELFTQIPGANLPMRWVDYTSPDVICLHVNELKKLADTRPEALQAICQATAAGANLWIWGAGENWERLAEIEERTGLWGPHAEPWKDADVKKFAQGLDGAFAASRSVDYSVPGAPVTGNESTNGVTPPNLSLPAPKAPPFRTRPAQLGMVLVFSSERPIGANPPASEDVANWVWATNTVGADRFLSHRRLGLSTTDDNPDFWKQMIPGVGRAPVTAFRVLITGFVLAIGPVNYYWLRRKGKLHLLLAVVPITAIIVTAGLFGYALLTDGLQVRVRPRSFTSIDQARRQAASVSRVTYYAGLSPSNGLVFEDDTMIQPIDAKISHGMAWTQRDFEWEGNRQRLASGWLASRTPTQLLMMRTRPTTNGLRITPAADGTTPAVVNALGGNLLHLVLCDEQGRLFKCGETAKGAACQLKEVTEEDLPEIRRYFADRAPVQLQDVQLTEDSLGNSRVYYYGQSNVPASQADGILEKSLAIATGAMTTPSMLAPRNYLAIVDQSPELDYGVEAVQQELPLHVIHGTW
jgi:hypothetical protein